MNAQEKLIQYANELKTNSNTIDDKTPQEIMGKAFMEGICYHRDGGTMKSCKIERIGKTIIVYDIIKIDENETKTETMRIEL